MPVSKQHISDMKNLTYVLYHIFCNNDKHYEQVDLNGITKAFLCSKASDINVHHAEIDAYALLCIMGMDEAMDELDEIQIHNALTKGKFIIREYNPLYKNTQSLVRGHSNISFKDLMYSKKIVIRDNIYKLILERKDNSRNLNLCFDCGEGVTFVNNKKTPIENIRNIRNALAHGNYDYNKDTGKISINCGGTNASFSLYWLRGLSEMVQNCKFGKKNKTQLVYIPTLPNLENCRNMIMLENLFREGVITKISINNEQQKWPYGTVYDTIYYTANSKEDRYKNDFALLRKSIESLGYKREDYCIEVVKISEVMSDYTIKNFCSRLGQVPNFFAKSAREKEQIIQDLSIANRFFSQDQLPTKISSSILDNLQELMELLTPYHQNNIKQALKNVFVENYKKSTNPLLFRPMDFMDQLKKADEAKKMADSKFDHSIIIPEMLGEILNPELKTAAVLMQGYNALVNTRFVDNICSLDDRNMDVLYSQKDQNKLLSLLDFSGFKYCTRSKFYPDDLLPKRDGRNIDWKNPVAQKHDVPVIKKMLLTKMRNAIMHGNVSVLYNSSEKTNEILFVQEDGKKRNRDVETTTLIKAPINTAFQLFSNPVFMQVLDLTPEKTFN